MNDCERYQELICCLIDGELTRDERKALMAHIALCPECRASYEVFSAVSDAVASDLVDVPESLHENIMSGVRRRALFNRNKRAASRRVKGLIAAAACFAVVLISAVGIFDTLLSRDASVAENASPAAAQSFDEFGNVNSTPELIPVQPSASPAASVSVPLPSAAPPAASSAPAEPDKYSGTPAATERPVTTRPPLQTQAPALIPTPPPVQTQTPIQTPAPVQTQSPVQTQTPVQTPAPVQTQEPVMPSGQTYAVDNDPSAAAIPAPQAEIADAPALSAAPTASDPDQGDLTAQSAEPSGLESTPAPAENESPAPRPPKRSIKRVTPAAEAPAAEAQGIETDPALSEPGEIADAPVGGEEETSFADKILRSFKAMFGISEPSATHAPEKLSEDDVDVIVDLTEMKDYKPFSDLLLGELSELPEGNADRVYLFRMKNGDMEIKLLAYAYGDAIYYTIHDELVQQNIYLADCTLDELEKFILPYLPEAAAAPTNGSPANNAAANQPGVTSPVSSAAPNQISDASNIIPADPGSSPGIS